LSAIKWPKISIVTPSFNQGQYLESTINSVLSQGYPNLEYIIIDGGSTDNSLEIIKKYSPHLHFWCSKADDGHYCAVNEGFAKASGDIFAWLNSDDLYCMDAFKTVGAIFSHFPNLAWLTTLQQLIFDSRGRRKSVKYIPGFSKQAFLDGLYFTRKFSGLGFIQQESTFWRRELWEKVGGIKTKFSLAGDFDLWARFFLYEDLYGVDQPLGGFRIHGKNRSRQLNNTYIREAKQSLEEIRLQLNWTRGTRLSAFWNNVKWMPIVRRLSEFCNMPRKNMYTSTVISQADPRQENQWQMTTAQF
jgi:glycosyltransferase involved in cell wall biosynthesis